MAKNTWGQNFGNSVRFGISSVSDKVLANLTPGIHSMLSKNDDYFNNIRETLMELKTGQTKVSTAIARTSPEMGKALEDINNALSTGFKNTTHFFKTGDISGPHKMPGADVEDSIGEVRDVNLDDASADATEKMDDELFNFDDLPSPEEAMAGGRDPGADAEIAGAKAQVGAIKASTEAGVAGAKVVASNIARVNNNISATGALVAKGLTANVKSMNQNFLMTNALMEKSMTNANETLKLVNENVARLVDFNKDTQSAHIKAAMSYYTDSLKELRSISESLNRAYPEHKAKEKPKSQYERALGYGFDLGEYFGVVKENFGRTEVGSMLSQVLDPQVLENYIARGPIVLLEELAPQIVPVVARTALKEFDQVVTSFIPALLGKLGAYAEDMTANPVLQMIGSIFGIKSPGASMSLGQYEKGAVPFDGITHKTINQVIPTYLSKILAALTNTEEMHFDHESGTFKSMSQMRSENAADEDRLVRRSFGDLAYRLNRMDEELGINFRNNEEQKLFREFINEFMKTGAYQGKFLNFNDESQMDELFNMIRQTNQKFSQYEANNVGALEGWRDVLLNYIRNAPRSEQLAASMAGHEFYNELNKYYDQTKNTGSQKYAIVHSGFDDNKMASMVSAANARAREAGYGRTEYDLNTNGVILDNILNGLAFNNGGGPGNGGNLSGSIDPRRLTGVQGPIGKKARQIEMLLSRTSDPIVRQTLLARMLESFDKESQEYAKTHEVKLRTTGSSQLQGDRYSAGFVADADRKQKELDALIDAIEKDETSEEYDKAATEEGQILIEDLRGTGAYENILRKNKERKEAARNQVNLEEYYENGGTKSVEELMAEGRYSDRNNNDLEQIYDEEELHEREYDKMGFTDKLKYSLLQKPSEVIASALGTVNEMLYRVIFGGDENVGALEAIVENVKSTFDGLKEWLVKDIFRPIKEYFIGDDFTESKFYKSMQSFFDFLKGEKDENGVYSGGFMSEMANEMSDMRKQAANLITGKEQTLSDGTKIGENADSLAGTAKSGWNTFSNAFKDQYFGDQKDSQEAQRNAMGNLIDQLNDSRKVEPSEAKPKTESNEAKPEGNKALGGGVPKSGTYILSAGETILGNYARGTRRIARNKGKRLRQKITKTGAYFLNEGADVLPAGTGSPSDIERSQAAEANFMGKTLNYVFGSVRGAQDKTNILLSDVRNVLADKIVPATEDTAKATKAINESSGTESSSDEKKEDKPIKPSDKAIFAQIDGLMKSIVGGNEEIQKYRKKPLIDVVFDKISNAAAQFAGALGGSKRFDTEYVQKEYAAAIRAKAPSAISKGLVGGVAVGGLNAIGAFGTLGSLLLPGGPIGGIMVGLGVSMLHHNDSFLKMMYGEVGADGKRQGGVIPKSAIDWVEKNKTAILGGTAFGALKALTGFSVLGMLPGMGAAAATPIGALGMAGLEFIGPVLATVGIATAMRGDKMQRLLFGDPENADLKKTTGLLNGEMAKKVKQFLPNALVGTGGGYLGFSALNTMGLIGVAFQPWMGAILGGAMGIGLASDKFRDAMFGKMENGEFVSGGLVDQMKNFFKSEFITPAANFGLEMANKANYFIKSEIMYPIAKAFEPYKAVIGVAAKKIGKTFDEFFTKTKNFTMEVFKTITWPFRKLATVLFDTGRKALAATIRTAAWAAGKAASAPLKLLSFMAPNFKDSEYAQAIEEGKQRADRFREKAKDDYEERKEEIEQRVKDNDEARKYYRKHGYKDTQEQLAARTEEYHAEEKRIQESQKKAELDQAERDANIREQTELLRGILDRMGYFIDYADDRGRYRLVDAEGNVVHNTLNPDVQPVGSNIHGEGGAQETPREKTADGKPATVEHTLQSMDKTEAESLEQQKLADDRSHELQERQNELLQSSLGWWNKIKMGLGRGAGETVAKKVLGNKEVRDNIKKGMDLLPPELRAKVEDKYRDITGAELAEHLQNTTEEQTDTLVEKFDQVINAIVNGEAPATVPAEGETEEPKEKKKEPGTEIVEREKSQKEEYGKSDIKKYNEEQAKKKEGGWKATILKLLANISGNTKDMLDWLKGTLGKLLLGAAGLGTIIASLKQLWDDWINDKWNAFSNQIASDIASIGLKTAEALKKHIVEAADSVGKHVSSAIDNLKRLIPGLSDDAAEQAAKNARRGVAREGAEAAAVTAARNGRGVVAKLAHGYNVGSGGYQKAATELIEAEGNYKHAISAADSYKFYDPQYSQELRQSASQIVESQADNANKIARSGSTNLQAIASGAETPETKGMLEKAGKIIGEMINWIKNQEIVKRVLGSENLAKFCDKLLGAWKTCKGPVLTKYLGKIAGLVAKFAGVALTGPVALIAIYTWDVYRGFNDAAELFQIRPDDVTPQMRLFCAAYNCLIDTNPYTPWLDLLITLIQDMTGGALPFKTALLTMMYEFVSMGMTDVSEKQKSFKDELAGVNAWRKENGKEEMSALEYSKYLEEEHERENPGVMSTIWKATDSVAETAGAWKTSITNMIDNTIFGTPTIDSETGEEIAPGNENALLPRFYRWTDDVAAMIPSVDDVAGYLFGKDAWEHTSENMKDQPFPLKVYGVLNSYIFGNDPSSDTYDERFQTVAMEDSVLYGILRGIKDTFDSFHASVSTMRRDLDTWFTTAKDDAAEWFTGGEESGKYGGKSCFVRALETIGEGFRSIAKGADEGIKTIRDNIASFVGFMNEKTTEAGKFLTETGESIVEFFTGPPTLSERASKALDDAWEWFSGGTENGKYKGKCVLRRGLETIFDGINGVLKSAMPKISNEIQYVVDSIGKFYNSASKAVGAAVDVVMGAIKNPVDFASKLFGGLMDMAKGDVKKSSDIWSAVFKDSKGGGFGGTLIPNIFGGRGLKQNSGAWANTPVKAGHPELGTIRDGGCGIAGLLNNANSFGINMGLKEAQSAISSNNIARDGSGLTGQFFKDAAAKSGNSFNQVGTDTPVDMEKALGSGKSLIAGVQTGQGGHYVNARGLIKRGGKSYTMVDDPAGGSALMSTKALSGYINGPRSPRVLGYMSKGRSAGGRGGWLYGGFGNKMFMPQQSTNSNCTLTAAAALINAYKGTDTTSSNYDFGGSNWWYSSVLGLPAEEKIFSPGEGDAFVNYLESNFGANPEHPMMLYQVGGDGSSGSHPLNRGGGAHATVVGRRLSDGTYEVYDSNGGMIHKLNASQIFDPSAKGNSQGYHSGQGNILFNPTIQPSDKIDSWSASGKTSDETSAKSNGSAGSKSSGSTKMGLFAKLSKAIGGILGQATEMALTGNIHEIDVDALMRDSSESGRSSAGSGDFNSTGNTEEDVWDYLTTNGYTKEAAAGIMGPWKQESSIQPKRVEWDTASSFPGYDEIATNSNARNAHTENLFSNYASQGLSIDQSAYKGNDGTYYPGFGLAQWTGSRGQALLEFAKSSGGHWYDIGNQIKYFNQEMENKVRNIGKDDLNNAGSVEAATDVFTRYYEGNTKESYFPPRRAAAREIYNKFKDRVPTPKKNGGITEIPGLNIMGQPLSSGDDRAKTEGVVIHHSASPNNADWSAEYMHKMHQGQGWNGIGYHYVVRQDGTVERGRDEGAMGAHAKRDETATSSLGNQNAIGINLTGDFSGQYSPSAGQIDSAKKLIGGLSKKYNFPIDRQHIVGHREVSNTACPGDNLYAMLPDIVSGAKQYGGSGGPLIPKEFGGKGYIHGGTGAKLQAVLKVLKAILPAAVFAALEECLAEYPAIANLLEIIGAASPTAIIDIIDNAFEINSKLQSGEMSYAQYAAKYSGNGDSYDGGNGKPLIKPPKMYRSRSGGKGFGGLSSMMHNGGMGSTDDFLPMSHNQFVFDNHINTPNGADSTSILNMMKYLSIKAEAKVMIEYLKRIADNTFGGMKVNVTGGGSSPLINGGKGYTDQTSFKLPSERPTMNKADFEASQRLTNPGGNNGLSAMHMKNLEIARGGSFRSI